VVSGDALRVVVTGGREFTAAAQIEADLRSLLSMGLQRVAHGAARKGADPLADEIAKRLGLCVPDYPADWREGKRAGLIRNVEMLESEKPGLVLAYPDPKSRGTWHCTAEAAARNIPVLGFIPWWEGDIAELVERETRRYGKVATGVRKGTHVIISRVP